jgi:uncharacterized membrane protein
MRDPYEPVHFDGNVRRERGNLFVYFALRAFIGSCIGGLIGLLIGWILLWVGF